MHFMSGLMAYTGHTSAGIVKKELGVRNPSAEGARIEAPRGVGWGPRWAVPPPQKIVVKLNKLN